jgi:hypothetical protein
MSVDLATRFACAGRRALSYSDRMLWRASSERNETQVTELSSIPLTREEKMDRLPHRSEATGYH